MTNIILFQRELRQEDNYLIYEAIKAGDEVIPIFIFDKTELSKISNKNCKRVSFLVNAILNFKNDFKKNGKDLLIFYGNKNEILSNLVDKHNVNKIFVSKSYEKSFNKNLDKKVVEVNDNFLTDLNLKTNDNSTFKIFKQFKKKFLEQKEKIQKVIKTDIKNLKIKTIKDSLNIISAKELCKIIGFNYNDITLKDPNLILQSFLKTKIQNYDKDRNCPSLEATSGLSPYLRFGLISIRKCYFEALNVKNSDSWISELLWRDFYATIFYQKPELLNLEYNLKFRNAKWNNDKNLLKKFLNGETGFPIIDAGIKELLTNGTMHNRIRMVVASFFTKNLYFDWRIGEKFFADYLLDYEYSSNVGGWQWSSSCGFDSQPYFRIFNPFLQTKNYDENGEYIKKYVPQLKNINAKILYQDKDIDEYYKQIVSYKNSKNNYLKLAKLMK